MRNGTNRTVKGHVLQCDLRPFGKALIARRLPACRHASLREPLAQAGGAIVPPHLDRAGLGYEFFTLKYLCGLE